jgi:hypothetical protein
MYQKHQERISSKADRYFLTVLDQQALVTALQSAYSEKALPNRQIRRKDLLTLKILSCQKDRSEVMFLYKCTYLRSHCRSIEAL